MERGGRTVLSFGDLGLMRRNAAPSRSTVAVPRSSFNQCMDGAAWPDDTRPRAATTAGELSLPKPAIRVEGWAVEWRSAVNRKAMRSSISRGRTGRRPLHYRGAFCGAPIRGATAGPTGRGTSPPSAVPCVEGHRVLRSCARAAYPRAGAALTWRL